MLSVAIGAVIMLAWNVSMFIRAFPATGAATGPAPFLIGAALLANVGVLLFTWRRYVDLMQDGEQPPQDEYQFQGDQPAYSEASVALITTIDPMTGLLNRKGFADRAAKLDARATARGDRLSLFSIRLHRFKSVTDCHGASVGDIVLQRISAKLLSVLHGQGAIARLGSDEFAIAMIHPEGADRRIEAAGHVILDAVTRQQQIGDTLIHIGAFVGMAVRDADGQTIADLLRRADIAVEDAITSRAERPIWFDTRMERALLAQNEIEQGIRRGIKLNQFIPYFEPQIDLATGAIVGFEALARWQHPTSGMIMPDTFISVAEQVGLIGPLSEQVMRTAFIQAASWEPAVKLSVNISPVQLADSWFAQRLVRLLAETGFPASRLVVEITESSLFADIDQARTIVTSLKNQGIQLALDDFGTGFSSLSHLRSLPFDVIKVDRSFTATIHRDPESAAIVSAVATLANALGMPVTVEGIEDAATERAVIEMGGTVGQGWYYGKPMANDQATELLRTGVGAQSGNPSLTGLRSVG